MALRILSWTVRIVLFLLIAGFAAKNTDVVTVRYLLGLEWQTPLVLLLLVFFAGGAALGVLATLRHVIPLRRELQRLRRATGQGGTDPSGTPG
jgi:uncharacterized integral membrane protein